MLATAPRGKWPEGAWAAATGAIAALPSACDALIHGLRRTPFSLEWFESIQIGILLVSIVWMVASLFYSQRQKTSLEYLENLYHKIGDEKRRTS
jgi:hypothetical protein